MSGTWDEPRSFAHPDHHPGDIVWLPPNASWLNAEKSRPFAVAQAHPDFAAATLAFGSTRETEKVFGAAWCRVTPSGTGINRNGLGAPTLFYPGALLRLEKEDVPVRSGRIDPSRSGLRRALRAALGIGAGPCAASRNVSDSRRGRIVRVGVQVAEELGTSWAIILTEPAYSRAARYQVIVPVRRGDGFRAGASVLRVSGRDWLRVLDPALQTGLIVIPLTQSVWHRDDIAAETESVVDAVTLAEIDERLCAFFSLDPP